MVFEFNGVNIGQRAEGIWDRGIEGLRAGKPEGRERRAEGRGQSVPRLR